MNNEPSLKIYLGQKDYYGAIVMIDGTEIAFSSLAYFFKIIIESLKKTALTEHECALLLLSYDKQVRAMGQKPPVDITGIIEVKKIPVAVAVVTANDRRETSKQFSWN